MVSLADVQSSNSRIPSSLHPGLVAVFVGATNGVGETALRQFAKHTRRPRVYFVGRSQEAGDRISAECKALNSEGEYKFVKADISLIHVVDEVCRDIKSKEKAINLLFLSQGTLIAGTGTFLSSVEVPGFEEIPASEGGRECADRNVYAATAEGLHVAAALVTYSRNRFIVNLLSLLQQATALRRVVSVFAGCKEGPIDTNDFQSWKVPLMQARGHAASQITLSYEAISKQAPDVSFIHVFPGSVQSGIARGTQGIAMGIFKAVFRVIGPFVNMPLVECGERHLFIATSARYPASTSAEAVLSVPLADGISVARGTTGQPGSGVYTVDQNGESAGPKVEELLANFRKEGIVQMVWKNQEEEFKRIAGVVAV